MLRIEYADATLSHAASRRELLTVGGLSALGLSRPQYQGITGLVGVLQQRLASGGGGHTVALAQQQLRAHRVFQLGQALADGRGDHVRRFGGAPHVAAFANGDKQPQGGEVQVAHFKSFLKRNNYMMKCQY